MGWIIFQRCHSSLLNIKNKILLVQQLSKTATMYRFFTAIQIFLSLYGTLFSCRKNKSINYDEHDTFLQDKLLKFPWRMLSQRIQTFWWSGHNMLLHPPINHICLAPSTHFTHTCPRYFLRKLLSSRLWNLTRIETILYYLRMF